MTRFVSLLGAALFAISNASVFAAELAAPQDTQKKDTQSGAMQQQDTQAAKMALAPHSVMIQSQLQAAAEELKGLQSQLKVQEAAGGQAAVAKDAMEHLRTYTKSIGMDLKTATTHDSHLKSRITQFPNFATSEEYRNADSALAELRNMNKTIQNKTANAKFWKDQKAASNEMNSFQKQLDTAIEKMKEFNSKLDVSVG